MKEKSQTVFRHRLTILISIFLLVFAAETAFAVNFISGVKMRLKEKVIDLRANRQLRISEKNKPRGFETPEQLTIGSIFFTVDNKARKVIDIYEDNGRTIIETVEPRIDEVFEYIIVPDFSIACDRSDIENSYFHEGVTLLPPGADQSAMLSSNFTPPANLDRSVTWLDTDPDCEDKDIITLNIDRTLWSSGKIDKASLDKLKEIEDTAKEKNKTDDASSDGTADSDINVEVQVGGKPSTNFGAEGEVKISGTLRFTMPSVSGGFKYPSIECTRYIDLGLFDVCDITSLKYKKGYAKASVFMAQQFDFHLTGTVDLSSEVEFPIITIPISDATRTVALVLKLFARITLDGKIMIGVEASEFSSLEVGASCDIHIPFIPCNFSGYADSYFNFGFRPTLAAEAELRGGLYLGGDFEIIGITVAGIEGGGGLYILANGYMEPLGIMGYDTRIGSYGNFDDWILEIYAEAGAYAIITAYVLPPLWSKDLYFKRWPFWSYYGSWEL